MTPATITPPPAGTGSKVASGPPRPYRWTISEYREAVRDTAEYALMVRTFL